MYKKVFRPLVLILALSPLVNQAQAGSNIDDILRIATPAAAVAESYHHYGFEGAFMCSVGLAANAVTVDYLKGATKQWRPDRSDRRGMPSAHTAAPATAFGCMLGQQGWSGTTPLYALATVVVAQQRVEKDKHSVEQVVAGALIGTAFGYFSTQHLPKGHRVFTSVSRGTTGVGYEMSLSKTHLSTRSADQKAMTSLDYLEAVREWNGR